MLTVNNLHFGEQLNGETPQSALPEWQQKLHDLVQYYIEHTPAKQLGRSLRTYFLLHISGLKTIEPGWEDMVLHFITMLELIDDAEDSGL